MKDLVYQWSVLRHTYAHAYLQSVEVAEMATSGANSDMPRQALSPVDYEKLVERAISQGGEDLTELRRKARDAGVVRGGRCFGTFSYKRSKCFSFGINIFDDLVHPSIAP